MGNAESDDGSYHDPILSEFTMDEIAQRILDGKAKRIIVMTGAGISVAAGIPDFRSPETGLYAQLSKYDLPFPEAVFELEYFREHPEPFFVLAKEMWPGNFDPTDVHLFIKLLEEKKVLLRNFTQNIDCLERAAGINPSVLVECHGTFASAHTIDPPFKSYPVDQFKERLDAGETCVRDPESGSLVKPDIVFFGENLPERFFMFAKRDFPSCDLLIVMGTSLMVHPFCGLTTLVPETCPRVLINNEIAGDFRCSKPNNWRDVGYIGDVQEGVNYFVEKLGWKEDFEKIKERFPNRRLKKGPTIIPQLVGLPIRSPTDTSAGISRVSSSSFESKGVASPTTPSRGMDSYSHHWRGKGGFGGAGDEWENEADASPLSPTQMGTPTSGPSFSRGWSPGQITSPVKPGYHTNVSTGQVKEVILHIEKRDSQIYDEWGGGC